MTRPRIAAIVSGIAASTVAFLVVSRWHLAGTLTGAAIIPVIYTLVSHCSSESLDRVGEWMRRHSRRCGRFDQPSQPASSKVDRAAAWEKAGESAPVGDADEKRTPKRRNPKIQWSLAVFTSLALAVSIYSLVLPGPTEKTIIREKVIEKTVTVTTPAASSAARASSADTATTTTLVAVEPGAVPTTLPETSPSQDGLEIEPSSTTTSPDPVGPAEEPSSTTDGVGTTTTLLP